MVRAKMTVSEIRMTQWGPSPEHGATTVVLKALYDDLIPEDRRFQKATPSGYIEMQVDNPAALAMFRLGKTFYVDFSPT